MQVDFLDSFDVACAAGLAVELNRDRKHAENHCGPEPETRIDVKERSLHKDRNPRCEERQCTHRPHSLPQPALNEMTIHRYMTINDNE